MPVWGTVLLVVLAGWLLLGVLVAFALGRAIRIADRRSPRKAHRARPRRQHPVDLDVAREERRQIRRRS